MVAASGSTAAGGAMIVKALVAKVVGGADGCGIAERNGAVEARDNDGAGTDDDGAPVAGGFGVDGARMMSECMAEQR